MGKIKTNEEIKKEIFRYLKNTAKRRSWKIEDFILSSISKNVGVEEERVKKILESLPHGEQELVKSIKIGTDIYLPTEGSTEIEKSLQMKKITMPVSPYFAFFIVIGVIWILASVNSALTVDDVLFLALLGLIPAYILQYISKEFLRWKVTSEKMYRDIYRLYKFSAYLTALLVLLLIVYYVFSQLTGSEVMPVIVGGIVVAFVSVIVGRVAYIFWRWS